jgi:Glycosyl hydrolases family 16
MPRRYFTIALVGVCAALAGTASPMSWTSKSAAAHAKHHSPGSSLSFMPSPSPTPTPTPTPSLSPAPNPSPSPSPSTSPSPSPSPMPSRSLLSPSGQAMPVGDLPGWQQIFTDDFTTNVPLGSFPSAVSAKWSAYPYPWKDTSKNGTYWPEKVVSINNGVMDLNLHTENINGTNVHLVSAPQPRLFPGLSAGTGQLYGRYAIRFKSDPVPGYKTAWLLWPDSGVWPRAGEIDFPEGNLDGTISAFMHWQNATSGSQQGAYSIGALYPTWHTAVIEWAPASCKFTLDGLLVGNSTTNIPNTAMHWFFQTETQLSGGAPSDTAAGHVQIDWVAAYKRS